MKRALVIGCGGAGKTTVARRIAERTGLPLVHLDAHFWRAGWKRVPQPEWTARVRQLTEADAWVQDGNYGSTMTARLARCDTVVYLDTSARVCLWRVVRRWLQYRGESRPEMPVGCPERLDVPFVWWILTFRLMRRPGILATLRSLPVDKRIEVLRDDAAIEEFLASLVSVALHDPVSTDAGRGTPLVDDDPPR